MKKIMKEWVIPFGIEIIVVLLLIKFAFFFVTVPTGSMIPTIEEGGWLFATRMYAPESTVSRGDIIVFNNTELGKLLIKRTVGLPGDTVTLTEDGKTIINGEELNEDYVVHPGGPTGEFTVPEGHYLFLGDNRKDSADARYWKEPYIPADELIGEARFSLWPLNRFGILK